MTIRLLRLTEAAIWVKLIDVLKSQLKLRNRKKDRNQRHFNMNFLYGLGMDFIACYNELMHEGTLTPFALFDAYRYFAAHARLTS